ncbi:MULTISPECIES: ExeA family protein [unclassified Janthinobacterium]|uniref:ExeA family protein n=1 Tax=unclassified Janthinobacterium TaxID=2610881 RepID=UPI00034D3897|nr:MULTISPECIES: AAA family ATPase [unclassified Janthinobacterium]MEC5160295.1 MSHA biogenesis protein MshM [Janthinobacterium sp. CG_S6]
MYHAHFGLDEAPFSITPNPAFFYSGNTRGAILDALLYSVIHGEGIIKVTGEVGSGKTMLCRMLESQLPPHIEVIYLVNPSLAPDEVLFAIAGELNLASGGKRADEVLRLLHGDLIDKHAAGRQVVLLVEEAQAMPLATLEQIRLLTNLETAHHKLLQIVLFGQPELDASLNLPEMRQLKERITHSFAVPLMAPELVPEFLACRLGAAGHRGAALFDAEAVRQLAAVSRGIVRRINILADKAMLAAFADDAAVVGAKHVRAAIGDSAFGRPARPARRVAAAALGALLLAGAAAWAWLPAAPAPAAARARVQPLQACLDASRAWLAGAPAQHLALQIMVLPSSDRAGLNNFLRDTGDAIGLQQVHAYPLRLDGAAHTAIVYGSFRTRAQAEAVQALLSEQGPYRPRIVDVAAIRAEVAASGAGPLW